MWLVGAPVLIAVFTLVCSLSDRENDQVRIGIFVLEILFASIAFGVGWNVYLMPVAVFVQLGIETFNLIGTVDRSWGSPRTITVLRGAYVPDLILCAAARAYTSFALFLICVLLAVADFFYAHQRHVRSGAQSKRD
jgi:hypothetical protein